MKELVDVDEEFDVVGYFLIVLDEFIPPIVSIFTMNLIFDHSASSSFFEAPSAFLKIELVLEEAIFALFNKFFV
tara:strand:+ start:743 stop:964 length:222 start_codon:yes stop_codon:yes gene_type:complete